MYFPNIFCFHFLKSYITFIEYSFLIICFIYSVLIVYIEFIFIIFNFLIDNQRIICYSILIKQKEIKKNKKERGATENVSELS